MKRVSFQRRRSSHSAMAENLTRLPRWPARQGNGRFEGGFSLIEVLFAVTFLVLVGVAMASLNNAAARLTETTELKQIALGLNEQSLAFVALEKRTKGGTFASAYSGCITPNQLPQLTCYVVCQTGKNPDCQLKLQPEKATVPVGTSKLQFASSLVIREAHEAPGRYLVNATTSWGKGTSRQMTTAIIVE